MSTSILPAAVRTLSDVFQANHIDKVWLIDFEFTASDGERPQPLCVVAYEWRSGQTIRRWILDDRSWVLPLGPNDLIVAYLASAEIGCYHSLQWPEPQHILDLFVEFRNLTNGQPTVSGNSLLGALAHFGLASIEAAEKEEMRALAMRGGPYTESEQESLINYCESDVQALVRLLSAMLPHIDLPRALLRGRYMKAVARMETTGIPLDEPLLRRLELNWSHIQQRLIVEVDRQFGVYENRSFKLDLWKRFLAEQDIPWPRLPSGELAMDDETFRQVARRYPAIAPIRELRHALGQMRLCEIPVGEDGRNRCMLSPFRSKTGRNQPSNSRFIFGPSCWLRSLIQPRPGQAIAYIDWSAQEIGIAAALSGDPHMKAAYESGDPYLWLAKAGGFVPEAATKGSHPQVRDTFKVVYLAANYGMGELSLAELIGQSPAHARELLRLHRTRFPLFWRWSDGAVNQGMLNGVLWTVFGWRLRVGADARPTSLRNFPVQANGAEMMRLACCLATERGISVCAPIHDALLVEGPSADIDAIVTQTQQAMQDASRIVLGGFPLRTDAKIVRHPNRYSDPRGEEFWAVVMGLLHESECADGAVLPSV